MIQPDNHISAYPILYSFRRCPYAMRARLALIASGRMCELREVVLRDKPQEMLDVSPKGTVPVLIDIDGRVIDESIDIMLWALTQNDPEKWLMPEQGSVAEMLELIAEFDDRFKYHLDRYKYPNRYEDADAEMHRASGALDLDKLNAKLSATTYLFGNSAALADRAIAPFVRQFAHVDQDWFEAQPWLHLQSWLAAFADSKIYKNAMQKYPRWESGNAGIIFPTKLCQTDFL
jgi:glutathione S-transferase